MDRVIQKFTFVILGTSGDLSKLKLLPGIYELAKAGIISDFAVIGVAGSERTNEEILSAAKANIKNCDEAVWSMIVRNFSYVQVDFNTPADFDRLAQKVKEIETAGSFAGHRLFYAATLPEYFVPISEGLAKSGLVKKGNDFQRVIYEKPFGADLASAQAINKSLLKIFDEKNIYRADHYLGKELVANIALLRFTNRILEPLWSHKDIDSVQIILDENFSIKNRGAYYDRYGALRDMLQSHALQVLSLLAMESPSALTGDGIRAEKAKVLKKTKIDDMIFGQYEGYRNEKSVMPDSETETFFAAKLSVDLPRWRGVPFFVRAGKNMSKKETVVHIRFKDVECLLTKSCPSDNNYLSIRIDPAMGFGFEINSKAPRGDFEIQTIDMDSPKESAQKDAYAVLIYQALVGEQSFFICRDEIEYAWKIVDAAKKKGMPVFPYKVGANGPDELSAWSAKHNIFWKS